MRTNLAIAVIAALGLAACSQAETDKAGQDAENAASDAGAAAGDAANQAGEAVEGATNEAAGAVERATDDNEATQP